jgi:predicted transglutaminase-like cysteine proteinase
VTTTTGWWPYVKTLDSLMMLNARTLAMKKKQLQKINKEGNAFPFADEVFENWSPDMYAKDCDSYASWKYLKAKGQGVSHKHLAIVTCSVDGDEVEDHAVLCVYSPEENEVYVLDNRYGDVETIDFFVGWGYRFVRIPVYMQDLIRGSR